MVDFTNLGLNAGFKGGSMIFVDNEKVNDPRINLAIEEYLLRSRLTEDDILLFYINEPSIIIGRYQNALEEINRAFVEAHGIYMVRRLSGGGAVYHDLGNLCFSLITRAGKEDSLNFKKFTAPVTRALQEMGIPAELSGRNDILVDGRKISGNAIYSTKQGIVCHGTLLLNTDLSVLSESLNVKPGKIESKGIKSVRSRVANISEFLDEPMETEIFRLRLLRGIFAGYGDSTIDEIPQYQLTSSDWEAIKILSNERYMTWDWNYGKSPAFNVQKTQRFAIGEIDARIQVQGGVIQSIKFYGDFLGQEDVSILERHLSGVRYDHDSLEAALHEVDVASYLGGSSNAEFVGFLY
jgi:lipoate-protein ligase A